MIFACCGETAVFVHAGKLSRGTFGRGRYCWGGRWGGRVLKGVYDMICLRAGMCIFILVSILESGTTRQLLHLVCRGRVYQRLWSEKVGGSCFVSRRWLQGDPDLF